jgi:uncharacterized protein (DUF2336 family)
VLAKFSRLRGTNVVKISEAETKLLFELARDKTAQGRKALLATVHDLFLVRGDTLTDRERFLMNDILRNLVKDVEDTVRRALADQLAKRKDAPRDVVLSLANDKIEVAYPILLQSQVLQDLELVEIIHHRTLEYQLAIAMRETVSETVSEALVATGGTDVIKALLENAGAQISQSTLEYLVEESKRVDTYHNPLLSRPEISKELAQRMYWWVSAALREHILEHFEIPPGDLDELLEKTVSTLNESGEGTGEMRKSLILADRLAEQKAISGDLLVQTLRRGEIALFEALLSKITGIRPRLVRRLLFERGGEGLAVACKAISIDAASFASIFVLSRRARPYEPPPERGEVTRLLKFFNNIREEPADQLLRKWQRDPELLSAVWHIGQRAEGF